ncbi:hypothetical protein SDC9_139839 [bioreactor metagenome]|uniref:DUF6848 domain-containing protein n=1 Tax=bioreactor metagenome TaxID=1076179 RepID=A0A645DT86_9ZZZZ
MNNDLNSNIPTEEVSQNVLIAKESDKDIAALKEKYGKIYRITSELIEDDDNSREIEYIFVKPQTASYDRYVKTASKGMTKALQAFLFDNVIPEQTEQLAKHIEEFPALTLGIGQKLLALLGLSDNVNLRKL